MGNVDQRLQEARKFIQNTGEAQPSQKVLTESTRKKKRVNELTAKQREEIKMEALLDLLRGDISEGQLLQCLRKKLLGYSQDQFGKLVGISRKTISDFEKGQGRNATLTINQLFKPFGLRVGIMPKNPEQLKALSQRLND